MPRTVTIGFVAATFTIAVLVTGAYFGGVDFTTLGFGLGVAFVLGGVALLAGANLSTAPGWFGRASAVLLGVGAVASANPWFTHDIRLAAFARAAQNAKPLVSAIHEFQGTHGRPPASLVDLVPEYLPMIPNTGLWLHPAFSYSTAKQHWHLEIELSMDSFFYDPQRTHADVGSKRRLGDWVYAYW